MATVNIKEATQPKFFKARPVPYAQRELVGQELDRLENLEVLEKTPFSEWADPIVVVPKKDVYASAETTRSPSTHVSMWISTPTKTR